MIQLYKANKSNTGHAASISVNSKEGNLYVQFIKQMGYNEERHIGSFKGGDKATVKFNIWEMGALLDSFSRNQPYKTVHQSPNKSVSINAGPYSLDKNDPAKVSGYSLSISFKEEGQEQPKRFSISFNFAERQVFIEYLKFALNKHFAASYSEQKKEFEKRTKEKTSTPTKNEVSEPELEAESGELVDGESLF